MPLTHSEIRAATVAKAKAESRGPLSSMRKLLAEMERAGVSAKEYHGLVMAIGVLERWERS